MTGGAPYTVAQTEGSYPLLLYDPLIHCHRIRIIEEPSIRAQPFHILCQLLHKRDRAQSPHNPADTKGVPDRLLQSVPIWNFEISDRRGTITTDWNKADDVISPGKGLRAVDRVDDTHSPRGAVGRRTLNFLDKPLREFRGHSQSFFDDIHEANFQRSDII